MSEPLPPTVGSRSASPAEPDPGSPDPGGLPPAPRPGAPRPARLAGIDLARFLAVGGMVLAHTWPDAAHAGPQTLWVAGKAAALFGLLAGVGIAISTRSATRSGRTGAARRALAARGAVLLIIGLTIGQLGAAVAVILAFYGVVFWLAIPFLAVRDRTLVALAVGTGLLAPVLAHLAQERWPSAEAMASPGWSGFAAPGRLALDLLLTGPYPALTWLTYVLVGMVVGRAVLRVRSDAPALRRLAVHLTAVGAACASLGAGVPALTLHLRFGPERPDPLPGLWGLVPARPHSGTVGDLALTTGAALLTTGLCLLLGGVLHGRARRLAAPVLAAGAAPLTIYVVHVVVTTALLVASLVLSGDAGGAGEGEEPELSWWARGPGAFALQLALIQAIGVLLARRNRRGPLETLVTAVATRAAGRR